MKIQIEKSKILDKLQIVHKTTAKTDAMPILRNILLKTENNNLLCSSTNLQINSETVLPVDNIDSEGTACVLSQHILDIMKNMPEEPIFLETEENLKLKISSSSGKIKYSLIGLNAEDFPALPNVSDTQEVKEIDSKILLDMLDKTILSIHKDTSRIPLSGLYIKWNDSDLTMVSTDGFRLSFINNKVDSSCIPAQEMIIPRKEAIILHELLSKIAEDNKKISFIPSSEYLFIKTDQVDLSIKLIDSKFPDYTKIIPSKFSKKISINSQNFLDALNRTALLMTDNTIVFNIQNDNILILSAENINEGNVVEELDIQYSDSSESTEISYNLPIKILYNPHFFIDFLKNIKAEDTIIIEFNDILTPCKIYKESDSSENWFGIMMPVSQKK